MHFDCCPFLCPFSQSFSLHRLFPLPLRVFPYKSTHPLSPQSTNPHLVPLKHPSFLGHQDFTGLCTSFHTEAKQRSPLLHRCKRPWTNPCLLFGSWLSLWDLWGVWFSWFSFCQVAILFSSFNVSPNSAIELFVFCFVFWSLIMEFFIYFGY